MTVEQRTVRFYDDELMALRHNDVIFVPLSRLCDNLSIARARQAARIREHPVLSQGFVELSFETSGGHQRTQCLRVDLIPLWLAGVNANRVSTQVRDKLIRYQSEVATVLWEAFKPQIQIEDTDNVADDRSDALQQLAHIAEMGRAIVQMAEQQMELQRRVDKAAQVVRVVRQDLGSLHSEVAAVQVRLGVLEERIRPSDLIDDAQAAEIAQAVKALAEHLTTQGGGKNQYQGVFGELYRRFGVSSYTKIRRGHYATVLQFLDDWRAAAAPGSSTAPPRPEDDKEGPQ